MSSYLGNLVQYSDSDSDEDSACRDDGGTEAGQNDMVDNPKKRQLYLSMCYPQFTFL